MSASRPATSASSGSKACALGSVEWPRYESSTRCRLRAAAARVSLVEDQVQHMQHGAEPLRSLLGVGNRNGTPEALMLCFARLIRCAIVASGTRNALAISAVVRPPTARSVSAIAEDVRQRWMAAHEEQNESSSSSVSPDASAGSTAGSSSPARRLAVAAGRFAAHVVRHAPRCNLDQPGARIFGNAVARPLHAAASIASCTASSVAAKSRNRRITTPSTCGASSRSRCSGIDVYTELFFRFRHNISGAARS